MPHCWVAQVHAMRVKVKLFKHFQHIFSRTKTYFDRNTCSPFLFTIIFVFLRQSFLSFHCRNVCEYDLQSSTLYTKLHFFTRPLVPRAKRFKCNANKDDAHNTIQLFIIMVTHKYDCETVGFVNNDEVGDVASNECKKYWNMNWHAKRNVQKVLINEVKIDFSRISTSIKTSRGKFVINFRLSPKSAFDRKRFNTRSIEGEKKISYKKRLKWTMRGAMHVHPWKTICQAT